MCCRVSSVVMSGLCSSVTIIEAFWLRVRIPLLLILFFFKINVHIMYIALYSVRNKVKDWSLFYRQVALTNKSPLASLTILRYKNTPPGMPCAQLPWTQILETDERTNQHYTAIYCLANTPIITRAGSVLVAFFWRKKSYCKNLARSRELNENSSACKQD